MSERARKVPVRLILLLSLVGAVRSATVHAQCTDVGSAAVAIELASSPHEGIPVVLRVSDYYPSGASIGTAQATVTGTHIAVTQTNDVAPTLPVITCRSQLLLLGTLPAGNYDVVWTTTENTSLPFPTINTRVRTFAFTIFPATAVPMAGDRVLLLLASVVAAIGAMRSAT